MVPRHRPGERPRAASRSGAGSVEVVIPWRGGCSHREKAWQFCRSRYQWPLTVAEAPDGEWRKALAVMPAVESSEADLIVVGDADAVCDGLPEACLAVQQGAGWAVPHLYVHRLTEEATEAYMASGDWHGLETTERPYVGLEGGGFIVARRETLLEIPPDPLFAGWGQEDLSWAMALYTLLGPCWRGHAPLIHLFHPPAPRLDRKRGSSENWQRFRRYVKARQSHDEMRELLREAKEALRLHAALHAH